MSLINLYLVFPFIIFLVFAFGSILSLFVKNHYLDLWFSTSGMIIGMFIYVVYDNFRLYWYHYIPVIVLILIVTFTIATKIMYKAMILVAPLSTVFVVLISSAGINGFNFFLIILVGLVDTVEYSLFFNANGLFLLVVLILLLLYGLSAFLMRKQVHLSNYRVLEIGKLALAMHVLIEANLFFFSIYFLYASGILPVNAHLILVFYSIYFFLLIYLHFFRISQETKRSPYVRSYRKMTKRSLVFEFFGLFLLLCVFAPWWTISEYGFGITPTGAFLASLNITFTKESANFAGIAVPISNSFFISACFIISGGIELLLTSKMSGYLPILGGLLALIGFLFGISGFSAEQAVIFKPDSGYSIYQGCFFNDGTTVSWGISSWFLAPAVISLLTVIANVASEVERKGAFFGIIALVWLFTIPVVSVVFLPIGFVLLESFTIILWLFGSVSWAILWLYYWISGRIHPKSILG